MPTVPAENLFLANTRRGKGSAWKLDRLVPVASLDNRQKLSQYASSPRIQHQPIYKRIVACDQLSMFTLYAFSSDRTLLNDGGIEIECDHLPRIGEIIRLEEDWIPEEQTGDFVIFDIHHCVIEGEMITFVQVIAADEESRLPILRARGWLPDFDEGA